MPLLRLVVGRPTQGLGPPYAWQRWEYQWEVSRPGYYLIRSRATDSQGNTQPFQAPWNFRGYAVKSIHAGFTKIRLLLRRAFFIARKAVRWDSMNKDDTSLEKPVELVGCPGAGNHSRS